MTSRERVHKAIHHQQPDRVPLDLGSTSVTGIHAAAYGRLKQALGLSEGEIRVIDPFQMLAGVEDSVRSRLGVDTLGIQTPYTAFGFRNRDWKPWKLFDGTPVLVPGDFQVSVDANGDLLLHPQGDRSAPPSGRMARGGYYFDAIVRQKPLERLDARRWVEQTFARYTDEDARYLEQSVRQAFRETDCALIGNFCDGGLGDIGIVPAPGAPDPEGVRDPEEWYVSLVTRREHIREIFHYQVELALENLRVYHQACGDMIEVIDLSETDFGGQRGLLFSPELFRDLFLPGFRRLNEWVHRHTGWKVFFHTCGAVGEILPELSEAGMDILNPVQYSATGMDLRILKSNYGRRLVFWGAGIDTQRVLPFGTLEQIEEEVGRNLRVMSPGGGYVFSAVHNIQANVPIENLLAVWRAFSRQAGPPET